MKTMRMDAWEKVSMGITTFAEACRHTPRDEPEKINREMSEIIRRLHAEARGESYTPPSRTQAVADGISSSKQNGIPDLATVPGNAIPSAELAQQPESKN
jgi:hypothetical protein